jgi:uncharacterized protein (DUF169 family)
MLATGGIKLMDIGRKKKFMELWQKYFDDAELPICFYYTDQGGTAEKVKPATGRQCFIGALAKVRKGQSLCFDADSIGCRGGKRYLGFSEEMVPRFEYFLSCGIPGRLEGERYKKSPELVKELLKKMPPFKAPAPFIVFKRWNMLEQADDPAIVIFFATPDMLAGIFTLANYDEIEQNGVIAPFGSGCSTIVMYPYLERDSQRPRAVLGMFDVSARPFVPEETLTFAVPMNKLDRMIDNMDESFLITSSWDKVRKRIAKT